MASHLTPPLLTCREEVGYLRKRILDEETDQERKTPAGSWGICESPEPSQQTLRQNRFFRLSKPPIQLSKQIFPHASPERIRVL